MWDVVGEASYVAATCNGQGGKNSVASVTSYPALTFFLEKVQFVGLL